MSENEHATIGSVTCPGVGAHNDSRIKPGSGKGPVLQQSELEA